LKDYNDSIFIFVAVTINTLLGFYQESKAENALSGLTNYLQKKTKVLRNGHIREILTEELVPGDIINFSSGDKIPADGRIIHSSNLIIDESILTGESLPVEKNNREISLGAALGDKKSMVFSGTLVADGLGSAVITSTGINTEFGIISNLLTNIVDEATPLQKNINSFSKKLTWVVLVISAIIFLLGLYYNYSAFEMFMMSVAVAVAAIPEGLVIAITVILAVGVERLAKRKGVVRRLLSAETLGDTSIILTDKTGTLTEAKMNLARIDIPFIDNQASELEYKNTILKYAILCTDAQVENPEDPIEKWKIIGKSMDASLVKEAATNFGIKEFDLRKSISVIEKLPFNSQSKFSAVKILENREEKIVLIGAPEIVLKMCHSFYWNGKKVISEEEKASILQDIHKNATAGFRIIAVTSTDKKIDITKTDKIDGLSYLGNILLRDPVRKDVGGVIKEIENDGIKTVIVTGDHTGTAISVARELGIIIDKDSVIEQHQLGLIDDEELKTRISNVKIFSRIDPQSKVRIAKVFQSLGYVVAMTGDGVNDAPALKQADVGIAVGSGSEVAREASDLVLLDDSFNIIVAAIDEGRKILQNIKKVLVFCLLTFFDEILLVGGSIIFNIPMPLTAAQILWVNFIVDSLPTISLSYEDEKNEGKNIRKRISRSSIFDKDMKFLAWGVGVLTSVVLFILYYILLKLGIDQYLIKTFIFMSFGIYTLMLIFSVRSLDKNIWEYNPFSNKFTNISSILGIGLMITSIYNPAMQKLLTTVPLPANWLLAVFLVGFICFVMMETGKFLVKKKFFK
jgi:Ca2+-transporting ATPase